MPLVILFLLGCIICVFLDAIRRHKCPSCRQKVSRRATICPFCTGKLQTSSSVLVFAVFVLLFAALLTAGYWFYQRADFEPEDTTSDAPASAVTPATIHQFASAEEAQREAIRLFPELGVAGSKLNKAFLTRHKLYQQTRPDYFRDPSWPMHLAEEVSKSSDSR